MLIARHYIVVYDVFKLIMSNNATITSIPIVRTKARHVMARITVAAGACSIAILMSGSPRTTAPGEVRGDSIDGGTSHDLAEGDVLVVPSGVPHHFVAVTDPFLYFVVKVAS